MFQCKKWQDIDTVHDTFTWSTWRMLLWNLFLFPSDKSVRISLCMWTERFLTSFTLDNSVCVYIRETAFPRDEEFNEEWFFLNIVCVRILSVCYALFWLNLAMDDVFNETNYSNIELNVCIFELIQNRIILNRRNDRIVYVIVIRHCRRRPQ